MARAYDYAAGRGPMPKLLEAVFALRKFGVEAVYGRRLTIGEIRDMDMVERIYSAFQARQASNNWAEWAGKNPADASLLNAAMMEAERGRK